VHAAQDLSQAERVEHAAKQHLSSVASVSYVVRDAQGGARRARPEPSREGRAGAISSRSSSSSSSSSSRILAKRSVWSR
jgi:hypothetical protein